MVFSACIYLCSPFFGFFPPHRETGRDSRPWWRVNLILPIRSMRPVASGHWHRHFEEHVASIYRKVSKQPQSCGKPRRRSLTRNTQPIRINSINAVLSNPTYRICSTKEYSRPDSAARKHSVLHHQYLISKPVFRDRQSHHQPLAPQYSLNLSFLPISRRLALTVARSEGLMFPSSTSSPLALRA